MRMFFGTTSIRRTSGIRCLRHRLRIATATARLASCCPTMYLSRSFTSCNQGLGSRPWGAEFPHRKAGREETHVWQETGCLSVNDTSPETE